MTMQCTCGSEDIDIDYHVGFDINEDGEEDQHIDRCRTCGRWRFHTDVVFFDPIVPERHKVIFGLWQEKDE